MGRSLGLPERPGTMAGEREVGAPPQEVHSLHTGDSRALPTRAS